MQREDSWPVFSADEDKSIDHEGKYYVIVLAINGLRYVHIRVHINRRLLMKVLDIEMAKTKQGSIPPH